MRWTYNRKGPIGKRFTPERCLFSWDKRKTRGKVMKTDSNMEGGTYLTKGKRKNRFSIRKRG